MQFSIELPVQWPDALQTCALAIEDAGFDACFVTDHPFPSRQWLASGGHATLDPLVALAFAASVTTRLRLHTNCLVPAYRNSYTTAKAIATLDACSRGRVILGVAVGYLEDEFAALGVPFSARGPIFDTTLNDMRRAWQGDTGDNVVEPRPVQQPHPPIWVGGNSSTAMRRAIEHGSGWSPFPASPRMAAAVDTASLADIDSLAHAIERLHELGEEAGRGGRLDVCFTPFSHPAWREEVDVDELVEEARALERIGVTWLAFHIGGDTAHHFCQNVSLIGSKLRRRMPRDS